MAEPVKCERCGLRAYFFATPGGTTFEMSSKPSPDGVWAIRNGEPVVAVRFEPVPGKAPKPGARLPGFEMALLYRGHYEECASAIAAKVDSRPKTGTR